MPAHHVVIVGGGLAGLSAGAQLAYAGCRVTVLEKAPKLGGRAITIPIRGFLFNFGAHAIYARDRSLLRRLEKEIDLSIDWKDFSPAMAYYDLGQELTPIPATLESLYRNKLLDSQNKLRFAYEVVRTLTYAERGQPGVLIGDYLQRESSQVRDLLLTIASANFFTNEPEKIPSPLFFNYYRRLFGSRQAVAYIGGGWQTIVESFQEIITAHGGEILTKAKVTKVEPNEEQEIQAVCTPTERYAADSFLFCLPPRELATLFTETPWQMMAPYAEAQPTYAVAYDIGLSTKVERSFTYIYDKGTRTFITDISHYDPSCVPPGGQLLQAIAYLNEEEIAAKRAEEKVADIEALYDKHYAGWRDHLQAKRIAQKATVQAIKCINDQQLMPIKFYGILNAWFAGDWCEGEGQLSELSFSSAYEAVQQILSLARHSEPSPTR